MFDDIAGKIKALAKVTCGLGIAASIMGAFALWAQSSPYNSTTSAGVLVLVLGSLASWIGSFFTYGFGELIENTTRIHEDNLELQKILTLIKNKSGEIDLQEDEASAISDNCEEKRQVIQSRKMNHLKCIKLIARRMKLCVLYVAKFKNLTGSCAGIVELVSRMNNNNI